MSHHEYYVAAVMADRMREARAARRQRVLRPRRRWTRVTRPRLRPRLA